MRILFLSNNYPPASRGGYEQWCQEVAEALAGRGHQLQVLTSRPHPGPDQIDPGPVTIFRQLALEVESGLGQTAVRLLRDRRRLEQTSLDAVTDRLADFQPDAVLIWGMWNVPRRVPALVEQLLPDRVAYYFCDYWPSLPNAYIQRWQEPARRAVTGAPKRLLGRLFLSWLQREPVVPLQLARPVCVSQAVRDILAAAGVPVQQAQIVYGGTVVERFAPVDGRLAATRREAGRLRLLYTGRLEAHKGVHTAIQALAHLKSAELATVSLDIYGGGEPDYIARLQAEVREQRLEQVVHFHGRVPHSQMPAIMADHDALLFPSTWPEPFARTTLEAMAAGLVVVGTTTGGTGELLKEGETGLTFPAGDAEALAGRLRRLMADPDLGERLAHNAHHRVRQSFTLDRMVDQFEELLFRLGDPIQLEIVD